GLAVEEPEDQAEEQACQERRRDRKVQAEVLPFDHDVSRKSSQPQLPKPGPEHSDHHEKNSKQDECSAHGVVLLSPPDRYPCRGSGTDTLHKQSRPREQVGEAFCDNLHEQPAISLQGFRSKSAGDSVIKEIEQIHAPSRHFMNLIWCDLLR